MSDSGRAESFPDSLSNLSAADPPNIPLPTVQFELEKSSMKKVLFPLSRTLSATSRLLALTTVTLVTPLAVQAQDQELKIGVVAAESGSFVSAGNTIVAAANLATKQINDAGGIKVGGKTYKIKLYIRDNRTDVNVTIASARELVEDVGVKAIWGTETHDFSVSMAKITGAAKVLQFSGNSSLGAVLDDKSVAPGVLLLYKIP